MSFNRDFRQKRIAAFGRLAFGKAEMSSAPQRALRLLEEAIELYQACGAPPEMAHKLVDYVFSRPVGDPASELGGVGVTLLAMADALGLSAEDAERAEVSRLLDLGPAYFRPRAEAKRAAGLDLIGDGPK